MTSITSLSSLPYELLGKVLCCCLDRKDALAFIMSCREAADAWSTDVPLQCRWLCECKYAEKEEKASSYACACAARAERLAVVEYIFQNSRQQVNGGYVLREAANHGKLKSVVLIVERHGVDARVMNDAALLVAAESGHYDVVDILISKYNANVHAREDAALLLAIYNNRKEVVTLLLEKHGADVHAQQGYACYEALQGIGEDCLDMLRILVRHGADARVHNDICLREAAEGGFTGVVDFLITECGANLHNLNDCALQWAVAKGKTETVKRLLDKYGADVHAPDILNEKREGPLRTAVGYGHCELVRILIEEYGAYFLDVNESMTSAAYNGHLHMIKQLVEEYGANVNNCKDAVSLSSENGHVHVLEYLLTHDDNLNKKERGEDALLTAVFFGRKNVIELLLAEPYSVDPNAKKGGILRWAKMLKDQNPEIHDHLLVASCNHSRNTNDLLH